MGWRGREDGDGRGQNEGGEGGGCIIMVVVLAVDQHAKNTLLRYEP